MAIMPTFDSELLLPTPCHLLEAHSFLGMPIWVKRDDLLHPVVSGNKYRKLKYPLLEIARQAREPGQIPTLVTMGGLWSNHVHATAYAARRMGFGSLALIRGHVGMDSAMLDDCRTQGMQIRFVDRRHYRQLREQPDCWRTETDWSDSHSWLPEGGSDPAALHGVAELIAELPFIPDLMLVACGTAATLAGLLAGLKGRSQVAGIAVLNNAGYLRSEVSRLLREAGYPDYQNYELHTGFHHGGYAKVSPELRQFCRQFVEQFQVPIEPVYTGKVFFALKCLIQSGAIPLNKSVLVLHTGGMQGARGSIDKVHQQ